MTLGPASMLRPSAVVPSAVAFRASSASSNTHMGTCSHTIFSFCRAVRPFRPPLAQFFPRIKFPNSRSGDVPSKAPRREPDFILDIPLDVSAELGRTRLRINELLQLGQGSVVELNKLAGEPLEVYVNGKLVARGEAVVINEKFGVRLTDIISPIERVKQLA